jgi:hypothetical protein
LKLSGAFARVLERVKGPKLTLIYGSSCKALAALRCQDIHPCVRCRGKAGGCPICEWTGVGSIPFGSECTCAHCHASGKDHYKVLKRDPKTDPGPDPKPEEIEKPKKKRTRKQKRSSADE